MVLNENDSMFILNPSMSRSKANDEIDQSLSDKIEELTKIRKALSLDLKKIAQATKISTNNLKNIEGLRFEKLPPHPMRESFIDQYCQVIKRANKTT